MGAVNGIVQAGPSIIAQALPAMLAASNPMTGVNALAGAFGQAAKQGAVNAPGGSETAKALINSAAPQNSALAPPNVTPPADPAYSAAAMLSPFLTSLNSYLTTGPNKGVDWAKFKDQPPKASGAKSTEEGTKGLTWLLTNLIEQEKSAQLGDNEPSKDLKSVFTENIKVC